MNTVEFDFENRAQEITKNTPSANSGNPWKLVLDEDTDFSVGIVSPHSINLSVHLVKGVGAVLCNKMYFAKDDPDAICEECLKPGYKGKGFARPFLVRCLLGYVFDLVDKPGTSKAGKEFTHNPLKVIEVWAGQNEMNFERLDEAKLGGYLTFDNTAEPSIWRLRRNSKARGGGMEVPTILARPDLMKLGKQLKGGTLNVPSEILDKYLDMHKSEAVGLMMLGYGNLNKEFLTKVGYVFPEEKPADMEVSRVAEIAEADENTEFMDSDDNLLGT